MRFFFRNYNDSEYLRKKLKKKTALKQLILTGAEKRRNVLIIVDTEVTLSCSSLDIFVVET